MNKHPDPLITDKWITSSRGKKNSIDPFRPYAWLVEKELTRKGEIEEVAVVFLTNRECPFHCLMCDLWRNTTDYPVTEGSIPAQIEIALNHLPPLRHIKLYNSGSFFDVNAIPERDYGRIADLLKGFETVLVECHPRLIDKKCLTFRDMIEPELQIALGLETVHPDVLRKLNKRMTSDNFRDAVSFLARNGIHTRAFILLKPPFMSEAEGVIWAERSLEFAFSCGVECCTVIPVRPGNGAMDRLIGKGLFSTPHLRSLEKVVEYGIRLDAGRVFADVWDLKLFSDCERCFGERCSRLSEMNLSQKIVAPIVCICDELE